MSWQAPNAGNREALARREANRMRDFVYRQQRGNLPPSMGGMGGGSVVGQNSMGNTVYAPHLVTISNKDQNDNTQSNYEYLHVVGTCMNVAPNSGTNSDIKWIVHTAFDGQIILLTPRDTKTITLKAGGNGGGNIDITEDVVIADNQIAYLQWHNDHPSGTQAGQTDGSYALISGGSNVDESADYVWTGLNKFQNALTELGNEGSDVIKIIGEINGVSPWTNMQNPDGSGLNNYNIPVPSGGNSAVDAPGLNVDTSIIMNTHNIYDVDQILFARGASSLIPTWEDDHIGFEFTQADNGTDTGLGYHVASNNSTTQYHRFFVNAHYDDEEELRIGANGIKFGTNTTPTANGSMWFDGTHIKCITNSATKILSDLSGGVQLTDNPTWTGNHVFDTSATWSSGSPVKFQGDGANTAQTVVELGKEGIHQIKFVGEIHGDADREISNPDGGADIDVPGTDDAISIKAAVIMNTFTLYDLDSLVFSQSGSSTTPPPENDWVWIEANTGTSGSPSLTGMHYNVPTSKTHQFKVNGTEKLNIGATVELGADLDMSTYDITNVDGLKFGTGTSSNDTVGASEYGIEVYGGTSPFGILFNIPTGKSYYWNVNGSQEMTLSTTMLNITDKSLHMTSISSPSDPANNSVKIFSDSDNNGVVTVRKSNGTEVSLEAGGSGVALGDSPTWTGDHVFQEDVEIGTGTDDDLTIKSAIKGHTVAVNSVDGSGTDNIDDTVFVDANLDMNTWNVYDLDSLYFGLGTSSTSPAHDTDSTSIDADSSGLNFYTRTGDSFKFKINGTTVATIDSTGLVGGTSGANTTLSNLGTTAINADLITNSSKNLGESSNKWGYLFCTNIYATYVAQDLLALATSVDLGSTSKPFGNMVADNANFDYANISQIAFSTMSNGATNITTSGIFQSSSGSQLNELKNVTILGLLRFDANTSSDSTLPSSPSGKILVSIAGSNKYIYYYSS